MQWILKSIVRWYKLVSNEWSQSKEEKLTYTQTDLKALLYVLVSLLENYHNFYVHAEDKFISCVSICIKQVLIVKIKCFASVVFNVWLKKMTYCS